MDHCGTKASKVKERRKEGYSIKKQNEETVAMKNKGKETQHPIPGWDYIDLLKVTIIASEG